MRLFCLLAPTLLLAAACQPTATSQQPVRHQYPQFSFSCPGDWKTDAPSYVDSSACTVNCEKTGLGSSGVVSVSWFADSLDQDEVQGIFRQQLRGNPVYKTASIEFLPVRAGQYGARPARVGQFKFSLLGVAHAGAISTFQERGRTLAVLTQQALEDTATNAAGFRLLAQTLQVNGK